MSIGDTKAELINGAFSKLKISGITVDPSPEDSELALFVLESMMREYKGDCLGYFFEDEPDTGSKHGLDPILWDSVKSILAGRLMPDFGKGDSTNANPILLRRIGGAESFLFSQAATPRQTQYPNRQPVGSGNSRAFQRFNRFYRPEADAPNTCETKTMYIGDVSNFFEDFNSYLSDSEYIYTFTIESNNGLTVNSSSKNSDETGIDYQIKADGLSDETSSVLRVKISVTTTDSRIETRIIDFKLITAEI